MSKFKFILFPEHTYILTFDDYDGKPFSVEVPGKDIVARLRREHALDKFLEDRNENGLDNIEWEWENKDYE